MSSPQAAAGRSQVPASACPVYGEACPSKICGGAVRGSSSVTRESSASLGPQWGRLISSLPLLWPHIDLRSPLGVPIGIASGPGSVELLKASGLDPNFIVHLPPLPLTAIPTHPLRSGNIPGIVLSTSVDELQRNSSNMGSFSLSLSSAFEHRPVFDEELHAVVTDAEDLAAFLRSPWLSADAVATIAMSVELVSRSPSEVVLRTLMPCCSACVHGHTDSPAVPVLDRHASNDGSEREASVCQPTGAVSLVDICAGGTSVTASSAYPIPPNGSVSLRAHRCGGSAAGSIWESFSSGFENMHPAALDAVVNTIRATGKVGSSDEGIEVAVRAVTQQREFQGYFLRVAKTVLPPTESASSPLHRVTSGISLPMSSAVTASSDSMREEHEYSPPPAIGDWTVGKEIGRGGFAVVYRAQSQKTGRLYAVKVLHVADSASVSSLYATSILREISALRQLHHHRIVEYFGYQRMETNAGRFSDSICVFLEYVGGGSLSSLIAESKRGFSESAARRYIRQMLQGLEYLHSRNVVHADIKCANMLVTSTGDIKLTDFGTSGAQTESTLGGNFESVGGTVLFMSPERLCGNHADAASDIWSLGCAAIELLTGQPPWSTKNFDNSAIAAHHIARGTELPTFPNGISLACVDFLLSTVNRDPTARPSAVQLLHHPWILGVELSADAAVRMQVRADTAGIVVSAPELGPTSPLYSPSFGGHLNLGSDQLVEGHF